MSRHVTKSMPATAGLNFAQQKIIFAMVESILQQCNDLVLAYFANHSGGGGVVQHMMLTVTSGRKRLTLGCMATAACHLQPSPQGPEPWWLC